MRRTVDLRVAGQNFRVVSSASEDDLRRLAATVGTKLEEVAGKARSGTPQALLLAAIALAHEVEAQREHNARFEERTRQFLTQLLGRVDSALEPADERSPRD
jgi:cell division protein ZapA